MSLDLHSPITERPRRARRRLRVDDKLALALLVAAALLRIALIALGWPHLNSDEAVVGLMARHIAHDGAHPLFIWGVHYEGPFEAYIAALFFAIFGSSTFLLHLSNQALVIAFLIVMYQLTRVAFGRFVAVLTLLWLGFGSSFALHREIITVGGYQEMLLLGALMLLGAWDRLRLPEPAPRNRRERWRSLATYAGIGCCVGLGLWSSLLIAPLVILTVIALALSRRKEFARGGALALAIATVVSALPYVAYQVTRQLPALTEAGHISHPNLAPHALATQTFTTLAVGLPTLLGSPHVCAGTHGGVSDSLACTSGNLLFSLAVLAVLGLIAWGCVVDAWRWLRASARADANVAHIRRPGVYLRSVSRAIWSLGEQRTADEAVRRARWWVRLILLGVVAASLAGYVPSPDAVAHPMSSARYLLPILLATPIVIEALARGAAPFTRALPHSLAMTFTPMARRASTNVAALGLCLVVALALANTVGTLADANGPDGGGTPPPSDQTLMTFLRAHHIQAFYADYWTCYRLSFESDEQLHCAVRGQNGDRGLELINNHYPPYIAVLAQQPSPAYILPACTATDTNFKQEAATQRLPYRGYRRVLVGGYAVYYYPGAHDTRDSARVTQTCPGGGYADGGTSRP
ncbi:MAG TPA: hypothetical protein VJN88_11355 [Ktedonobacterales bacterium]|nr:hypothetical protein [Ktedonobacterales bacterium]